jgi:hypothetical protein
VEFGADGVHESRGQVTQNLRAFTIYPWRSRGAPQAKYGSATLKAKRTTKIGSPEGINLIRGGFFQLENHGRRVCRKFQEFGTDSRRTDQFTPQALGLNTYKGCDSRLPSRPVLFDAFLSSIQAKKAKISSIAIKV